jgi:8-oxo-dGTP diphosphatase
MEEQRPKVGLGVYIVKDKKILLGKRIGSHGANTWSPPGGHLEFNESFEQCSKRETMEETGIKIKNLRFLGITNDIFKKENKHYITIAMLADYDSGLVKIMEPNKCLEWKWFSLNEFPKTLFLPTKNLIKQKNNLLKLN